MKKIAKVLLTLGVLAGLMIPASVSAGLPKLTICIRVTPFTHGVTVITVPLAIAGLIDGRNGWTCDFGNGIGEG